MSESVADLKCGSCGHFGTTVVDSRGARHRSAIRRRRACESCGARFTTYESLLELARLIGLSRSFVRLERSRQRRYRVIGKPRGRGRVITRSRDPIAAMLALLAVEGVTP